MNQLSTSLTSLEDFSKEMQEGIAYAKAFVQLREKRIAVLEERLVKQAEELALWKAIAEELARQLAFEANCRKADDSPP